MCWVCKVHQGLKTRDVVKSLLRTPQFPFFQGADRVAGRALLFPMESSRLSTEYRGMRRGASEHSGMGDWSPLGERLSARLRHPRSLRCHACTRRSTAWGTTRTRQRRWRTPSLGRILAERKRQRKCIWPSHRNDASRRDADRHAVERSGKRRISARPERQQSGRERRKSHWSGRGRWRQWRWKRLWKQRHHWPCAGYGQQRGRKWR